MVEFWPFWILPQSLTSWSHFCHQGKLIVRRPLPFSCGHWYPYSGHLMISVMSFKATVNRIFCVLRRLCLRFILSRLKYYHSQKRENINYCLQRSCGKVTFSQACVILFTGEVYARHPPGQTSPRQTPPLAGRHPHLWQAPISGRQTPPGRQIPPWEADTPWADTPLGGRHPLGRQTPADSYCSGRYASYWNAFLFTTCLEIN